MGLIKGKHSKPELIVRRLIHGLGYRYGLIPNRFLANLISSFEAAGKRSLYTDVFGTCMPLVAAG
jgi:hypothetical protein